jgi:hypothetical protein
MAGGVRLEGMAELIRELTNAPKDIREGGLAIVREEVEGAAEEMRNAYPGGLKRTVKVDFPSSTLLIGTVKNTSPHSHLYEFGTQQRQTASGASRGVMHGRTGGGGRPITVPIAKRRRRQMFERLKQMLKDKGFEVTGG